MVPYSQRDPQWSNDKMGLTKSTLGQKGCLTTCFAMIMELSPKTVNIRFGEKGVYQHDLIIWKKVPEALNLKLIEIPTNFDNARASEAIKNYGFCLVEVDFDGIISSQADNHWVLYVGNQLCFDPWDGGIKPTNSYPRVKRMAVYQVPPVTTVPTPTPPQFTDQTKIPLGEPFGVVELQVIRSLLKDLKRDRDAYNLMLEEIRKITYSNLPWWTKISQIKKIV